MYEEFGAGNHVTSRIIGLSKDFVSKAMTIADNLSNFETSRNIGVEALYQIATLPPEQREVPHTIPSTGSTSNQIGRRLKHVKENDLAHGEFGKWHEDELGINRSVAAKFMKIVDELGDSNVSTSTHLGMDALYAIATLPPDQREQPHTIPSTGLSPLGDEIKTPDEMTVRELREVKRALKEREAAENPLNVTNL